MMNSADLEQVATLLMRAPDGQVVVPMLALQAVDVDLAEDRLASGRIDDNDLKRTRS